MIDPVIGSTSGTRFLPPAALAALWEQLCLRATVVTPNWAEAEALTGQRVRSEKDAEAAGRRLVEMGCRAALVKGGHGPGAICRDCLVKANGNVRWYASRRVKTRNTHGTGCVLSSAIAVGLARGDDLETAVAAARAFLWTSLQTGRKRRWGRGVGPAFCG